MISHQNLVTTVRDRADLDSTDSARTAIAAVISSLAHCLPADTRRQLADQLPGPLAEDALVPGQAETRSGTELITEIADRLDAPPERARYLAQAVLAGLSEADPRLMDDLSGQLSSDVLDVLAPAGEPPRRAASATPDVPTELSDEQVTSRLRGLTGWAGDHSGISRTVQLPADRLTPLVDRIQHQARQMNDHVHVERHPDGATFTLRTGRRPGRVTEPDLWLAERIDQAVFEIGSGGRPG